MCILSLYALLKVVGHYDLSVLSMSVMGFQKKSLDGWWVGGWGELYPIIFGFLEFFNFAKPLRETNNLFSKVGDLERGELSGEPETL